MASLTVLPFLLVITASCVIIADSTTNDTNAAASEDWTYEEEDNWIQLYESCKGSHQSPIGIRSNLAVKNITKPSFEFGEWYKKSPGKVTIINNGHTAQVNITPTATFSGGPLAKGRYKLKQYHFHWGINDTVGSEHSLDCRRYSIELHMVHFHENYSSLAQALGQPGGVAVLGVWMDVNPDGKGMGKCSESLKPLIKALKKIKNKGQKTDFDMLHPLLDLIPNQRNSYFTYSGSLTTPGCSENVTWIIFSESQVISHEQLQAFRSLQEEAAGSIVHHKLENNFRHEQPINNRPVYLVGPTMHFPPSKCQPN